LAQLVGLKTGSLLSSNVKGESPFIPNEKRGPASDMSYNLKKPKTMDVSNTMSQTLRGYSQEEFCSMELGNYETYEFYIHQ
jgi:hypothetical protein